MLAPHPTRGNTCEIPLRHRFAVDKLGSMDGLAEVQRLLEISTDPDNPKAEELEQLLGAAQHIAVVGVSRDPEKPARRVPSYLALKGYDVIPVNPNAVRILGREAFPTLGHVPPPIDIAVMFRPSETVGSFVTAAMEREERLAIWLQPGIRSDAEIAEARARGFTAVQDLCVFQVHRALHG